MKEFDYTDAKGKHTHRVVYELSPVSDKMLAIDLTEFSEEERNFYAEQLENLHAVMKEEIKQLGLGNNYRFFKEEGITNVSK